MKKYLKGGTWTTIGYLLSPLSFWNDVFINLPLAYAFGALFGLVSRSLFLPMMILGYWLTNVAGFIMMHHGIAGMMPTEKGYSKRELMKDIVISIGYTAIVALLVWLNWLRFPTDYFRQ